MSAIFSYEVDFACVAIGELLGYPLFLHIHQPVPTFKCAIYTRLYMRCRCSAYGAYSVYNDWHIKVFLEFSVNALPKKKKKKL